MIWGEQDPAKAWDKGIKNLDKWAARDKVHRAELKQKASFWRRLRASVYPQPETGFVRNTAIDRHISAVRSKGQISTSKELLDTFIKVPGLVYPMESTGQNLSILASLTDPHYFSEALKASGLTVTPNRNIPVIQYFQDAKFHEKFKDRRSFMSYVQANPNDPFVKAYINFINTEATPSQKLRGIEDVVDNSLKGLGFDAKGEMMKNLRTIGLNPKLFFNSQRLEKKFDVAVARKKMDIEKSIFLTASQKDEALIRVEDAEAALRQYFGIL
jgi:hypothetical protein